MTKFDDAIREALAPEAAEYLETLGDLKSYATTKNRYGDVLEFTLRSIPSDARTGWIGALVDAGYPADTADSILRLLGGNGPRRFHSGAAADCDCEVCG